MKSANRRMIFPAAVLALLLTLPLAGCNAFGIYELAPEDLVSRLCEDVDVPPYETVILDPSSFEDYAFVPYYYSLSAVAADALVRITPHSLVVIRSENGQGRDIAEQIAGNADPNKWLSTCAETVSVAYTDHYVVLVMSEKDIADAITNNFAAMAQELDAMDMTLLTADNPRYEQPADSVDPA